jgi:hypothetical protein
MLAARRAMRRPASGASLATRGRGSRRARDRIGPVSRPPIAPVKRLIARIPTRFGNDVAALRARLPPQARYPTCRKLGHHHRLH